MSCEDVLSDLFRSSTVMELVQKAFTMGRNYNSFPQRERAIIGNLLDPSVLISDFVLSLLDSNIQLKPTVIRTFLLLRQSKIQRGSLSLLTPLEVNLLPGDNVMINKLSKPLLLKILYHRRTFIKPELRTVEDRTWNSTENMLDIKAVEDVAKAYVLSQLLIQIRVE